MGDTKQNFSDSSLLQRQMVELQERASKDALSGLLNRGTAELYINRQLKAMSADEICVMMIVDLDNFKQVNDTLGHQAGDRVVQQAARTLSGLFRATDVVGRLGAMNLLSSFAATSPWLSFATKVRKSAKAFS